MNRLEVYKELYQKEIDRRSQLNNDLSIPIGIISVLATGIYFYITNFDFKVNQVATCIFYFFVLAGTVFLLYSIYHLLLSYNLLTADIAYNYIAFPDAINTYYEAVKEHYLTSGLPEEEAEKEANNILENYFISAYIRTTTTNSRINDGRSADLFRCKRFMLFALFALLFAFIPYLVNNFTKEEKVNKVSIPNGVKLNLDSSINRIYMSNDIKKPQSTQTQPPPQTPKPMPTPPPDRHIKEGEKPKNPSIRPS